MKITVEYTDVCSSGYIDNKARILVMGCNRTVDEP